MRNEQELLHLWMSQIGCVRYERIKEVCDYLNFRHALGLEKPVYKIFYPLLYSGVLEFASDGKYQITPTCVISQPKHKSIISNPEDTDGLTPTSFVGIYVKHNNPQLDDKQVYTFDLVSTLKEFPSIKDVVVNFEMQYDYNSKEFIDGTGLRKKMSDSLVTYFIAPNDRCYRVPHQSINPDAYNIAYCYDRAMRSESNGAYNPKFKSLKLKLPHIPILIFRVLMIESLMGEKEPFVEAGQYTFYNISPKAYRELNRIFCNTITSSQDE